MNQMLIRMIGKLEEDKKARWSQHLPELLLAYHATRSAVMGYSLHFLLFGCRPRIPVDYQFPTITNPPHTTKLEQSVAEVQKRLKSAFEVARQLTSEEAVRQQCYYDRNAGAVALQPGDVVMVHTDRFVGKRKVKDRWHDSEYVILSSSMTGLFIRSSVLLLANSISIPIRFSIRTASCLFHLRMTLLVMLCTYRLWQPSS